MARTWRSNTAGQKVETTSDRRWWVHKDVVVIASTSTPAAHTRPMNLGRIRHTAGRIRRNHRCPALLSLSEVYPEVRYCDATSVLYTLVKPQNGAIERHAAWSGPCQLIQRQAQSSGSTFTILWS